MVHATAICPFCRDESVSMTDSVRAHKQRLTHIKRFHPNESFEDTYLKVKDEPFRA